MSETKQVEQILEICRVSKEEAIDALVACNDDLELAIDRLLAGKEHSWQEVSKRHRCCKHLPKQWNTRQSFKQSNDKSTERRQNKTELYDLKKGERATTRSLVLTNNMRTTEAAEPPGQPKVELVRKNANDCMKHRSDSRRWRRKEKAVEKTNNFSDSSTDLQTNKVNRNYEARKNGRFGMQDSTSYRGNGKHIVTGATVEEELDGNDEKWWDRHSLWSTKNRYDGDTRKVLRLSNVSENDINCKSSTLRNSTQQVDWSVDSSDGELRITFGSLTLASSIRGFSNSSHEDTNPIKASHSQPKELGPIHSRPVRATNVVSSKNFHIDSWETAEGVGHLNDMNNSIGSQLRQSLANKALFRPTPSDTKLRDELFMPVSDVAKRSQPMEMNGFHNLILDNHSMTQAMRRPNTTAATLSSSSYRFLNDSNFARTIGYPLEKSDKVLTSLLSQDLEPSPLCTSLQVADHAMSSTANNEISLGFHISTNRQNRPAFTQKNVQHTLENLTNSRTFMSRENRYGDVVGSLWKQKRQEMEQRPQQKHTQRLSPFYVRQFKPISTRQSVGDDRV